MTTPGSPTSRSVVTRRHPQQSESSNARSPGSPSAVSSSSGSSQTTAAATAPSPGAMRAQHSASARNEPGPTGHKPTARSNASTAPSPMAGPTRGTTNPKPNAEQHSRPG